MYVASSVAVADKKGTFHFKVFVFQGFHVLEVSPEEQWVYIIHALQFT